MGFLLALCIQQHTGVQLEGVAHPLSVEAFEFLLLDPDSDYTL